MKNLPTHPTYNLQQQLDQQICEGFPRVSFMQISIRIYEQRSSDSPCLEPRFTDLTATSAAQLERIIQVCLSRAFRLEVSCTKLATGICKIQQRM